MPAVHMEPGVLPAGLSAFAQYQLYNCLDSAITAQLLPVMLADDESRLRGYELSKGTQALCLEVSAKGLPIDKLALADLLKSLDREATHAQSVLNLFTDAVFAPRLNPNSWMQVERFFYDFLDLPPIWKFDYKTKQRKRSTDRDALERLRDTYPSVQPFVNAILVYREANKLAGVFKRGLEPDGSLRCNLSPTGTETRRLSSQTNPFGRGTNAQNLNDRVRRVISAAKGECVAYADLKTAESFVTGFASGSIAYIDACSSGDLHTSVARDTWPELAWTGELKKDRAIAEEVFYRDFTRRDMTKKLGHASNYFGKPPQIAKHTKIDKQLVADFQERYFGRYPEIPEWHLSQIAKLQQTGIITNAFGLSRTFWGRRNEEATWREAIAHEPQGTVAEIVNIGLRRVQEFFLTDPFLSKWIEEGWRNNRKRGLLMQVHDAGLFGLAPELLDEYLPKILSLMIVPVDYPGVGTMEIPVEASVGVNWGKYKKDKNPQGLRDWVPGQKLHF